MVGLTACWCSVNSVSHQKSMAEVSERRRLLGDAKGSGGEDGEGSAQATGGSGKIAAFV